MNSLFLSLSLLLVTAVGGTQITISDPSIEKVTIAGRQAAIEKHFAVSGLNPGYNTLVVQNLPQTVEDNTITVSGEGNAELLSVCPHIIIIINQALITFHVLFDLIDYY
jgi:hypothetical protein